MKIAQLVSYLYTPCKNGLFVYWFNLFRTYWQKRFLYSLGEGSIIKTSYIVGHKYIKIGGQCIIGKRVILAVHSQEIDKTPKLIIGKDAEIGDDSNISTISKIIIGDGVLTGRKVMINNTSHGSISKNQLIMMPKQRPIVDTGEIIIEKNVWIGEMAVILGNVHIGEGAVIAANAVVTKDIPAFSVAVGVPAKVIKTL